MYPQLLSKGNIVLIRNRKRAFLLCACTAVLIYLDLRWNYETSASAYIRRKSSTRLDAHPYICFIIYVPTSDMPTPLSSIITIMSNNNDLWPRTSVVLRRWVFFLQTGGRCVEIASQELLNGGVKFRVSRHSSVAQWNFDRLIKTRYSGFGWIYHSPQVGCREILEKIFKIR